jgi:hypothetical protein
MGTDKQGPVHSVLISDAAQSETAQLPDLIHRDEREISGERAYRRKEDLVRSAS